MSKNKLSQLLVSKVASKFPEAIFLKETEQKLIAVTLDDFPARDEESDNSTRRILDVIDQYRQQFSTSAKMTFFITTNHVSSDSEIVKEISRRGHEVGNHGTTDHPHFLLSKEEFEEEFGQAHDALFAQGIQSIKWFRPAQGFFSEAMVEILKEKSISLGYRDKFVLGSMIPFDTHDLLDDPDFTLKNIRRFIFPGSILVLHGGLKEQAERTAQVLEKLLPELHQGGYKLVTLSELI